MTTWTLLFPSNCLFLKCFQKLPFSDFGSQLNIFWSRETNQWNTSSWIALCPNKYTKSILLFFYHHAEDTSLTFISKDEKEAEIWCVCVQVEKESWAVACITLADKQQRESWGGSTLEDCSSYCFLAPHVSTHLKGKKICFNSFSAVFPSSGSSNVRCQRWLKKKFQLIVLDL